MNLIDRAGFDERREAARVQHAAERHARLLIEAWQARTAHVPNLADAKRILAETMAAASETDRAAKALAELASREATERDIALSVATLMGVFGAPAGANAQIYSRVMVHQIGARRPSLLALENAVAALAETARFPPAIADVLEATAAEETKIEARLKWLERAGEERDRLARAILDEETSRALHEAEPTR